MLCFSFGQIKFRVSPICGYLSWHHLSIRTFLFMDYWAMLCCPIFIGPPGLMLNRFACYRSSSPVCLASFFPFPLLFIASSAVSPLLATAVDCYGNWLLFVLVCIVCYHFVLQVLLGLIDPLLSLLFCYFSLPHSLILYSAGWCMVTLLQD
ncbi:hypothetical protein SAY86_012419 [Trapa natans]|uniref:Uncharacterized protein n=1 Tax=Trapa natans TaxID=22666 RepID=A0AAN7MCZ0_TRANT|nr:hypothetical protein SAY86_012419 [Trapa natans]